MGGGSSELRSIIARLDELEVALEVVERNLVLRGRRLAAVEKLVNEHDKVDVELARRVAALEAFAPKSTVAKPKRKSAKSSGGD